MGIFDGWEHLWDATALAGSDGDATTTLSDTGTAATSDWTLSISGEIEDAYGERGALLSSAAGISDVDTRQPDHWEFEYLCDFTAPATFEHILRGLNSGNGRGVQIRMFGADTWEVLFSGPDGGGSWSVHQFPSGTITTDNRMLVHALFDISETLVRLEVDFDYDGSDTPSYTEVYNNASAGNGANGLEDTSLDWILAANGTVLHRVAIGFTVPQGGVEAGPYFVSQAEQVEYFVSQAEAEEYFSDALPDDSTQITAQGATTSPVAANATIAQTHLISAQGATTSPVAANGTIAQTHVIAPAGAYTAPVAANATFTQPITAQGAVTNPVAAGGSISQTHIIVPRGATTSPVAANGTFVHTHSITAQGATTSPVAASGSIAQTHIIVPAGATTNPVAANGSVSTDGAIVVQGAVTNPVAANGTVSQTHLVTAQGAATSPVAANATVSQTHVVVPRGAFTSPVSATGTVSQTHIVTAQGARTSPVAANGTVTPTHVITAQGAVTAPVAAGATITQTHRITARGAVTSPVSATGTIAQTHLIVVRGAVTDPVADEGFVTIRPPRSVRLTMSADRAAMTSTASHSVGFTGGGGSATLAGSGPSGSPTLDDAPTITFTLS